MNIPAEKASQPDQQPHQSSAERRVVCSGACGSENTGINGARTSEQLALQLSFITSHYRAHGGTKPLASLLSTHWPQELAFAHLCTFAG